MNLKSPIIIILAILFSSDLVMAQLITMTGMVSDKNTNENLLGATIKLKSQTIPVASSDLDGNFSFTMTKTNTGDSLIVSYIGYLTYTIYFVPEKDNHFSIRLTSAVESLPNFEITAQKPIAEDFVIQELNYLKIVTNPSSAADPLLAVRTMVSSSNTNESASISFRGSDPDQTRVFLNDVPIYDPVKFQQLNGLGTFSIFNARLVKSLLVFPGSPPLEFGNVGSGLIHISTDEQITKGFLEVSAGLANSGIMAGVPLGKQTMLKFFGNYQTLPFIKLLNPKSFNSISNLGLQDGGLHFSKKLGENSDLKIYGYGINENYKFRYQSPSLNDDYSYDKKRAFYTGTYQKIFSRAAFSVSNGLSSSRANTALGNYHTNQKNLDIYGGVNYQRFFSNVITTKAGITYDYRNILVNGRFPIKSYALNDTSRYYSDTIKTHRGIVELYQYSKYVNYPYVIGLGVRKNIPVEGQRNYTSLQGNFRYNLEKDQFINFSIGRYHSYSTPNPALYAFRLFRTDQITLDYSLKKKNYNVTAAAYYKYEKGFFNTKTLGMEFYASRNFGRRFTFDIAFSTIHPQTTVNDVNMITSFTYNPTIYNLRYNIKSNARLNLKWFSINALIMMRSGIAYTPVIGSAFDDYAGYYKPLYPTVFYGSNLPAYFRADMSINKIIASKKGNGNLILYLTLSNISNKNNVRSYYYNYDYSQPNELYFQKRFIYFGFTKTFYL